VREIGIHLEDVIVFPVQRPLEAGDVRGAEPQLRLAVDRVPRGLVRAISSTICPVPSGEASSTTSTSSEGPATAPAA